MSKSHNTHFSRSKLNTILTCSVVTAVRCGAHGTFCYGVSQKNPICEYGIIIIFIIIIINIIITALTIIIIIIIYAIIIPYSHAQEPADLQPHTVS